MNPLALAIDLGGTNFRVALVAQDGRIQYKHSELTRTRQGRDVVVRRLMAAIERALRAAEADSVVGIGVAQAAPTEPVTGVLHNAPNLPGWDGFSLKPAISKKFSLPVAVANDANAATIAEHRYGAGRGYSHMIYMTVSTGIGGGVVLDGKLYIGSRGFAGEVGHITIDRDGPPCNCGRSGCLEAFSSGTAVARRAGDRLSSGERSVLQDSSGGDLKRVTAKAVAQAARAGDAMAQSIMAEASSNLGIGIVSLIHAFDPEIIVVGGGMARDFDMLLPGITHEIERHEMSTRASRIPVVESELGDDATLIGVAAMAFEAAPGPTGAPGN